MKKNKGYTIVEIILVIVIISIFSSIIINYVTKSRAKARDAQRLLDISKLQLALELYYNDNGSYPASCYAVAPNGAWTSSNSASYTVDQTALGTCPSLLTQLAPYLSDLPHDPLERPAVNSNSWPGTGTGGIWHGYYAYSYYAYQQFPSYHGCSADQFYFIVYRLEIAKGPDTGFTMCDGYLFQYGGAGAHTNVKTVGVKEE